MAKVFTIILFAYFFVAMPAVMAYKAVSTAVEQVHRSFSPVP